MNPIISHISHHLIIGPQIYIYCPNVVFFLRFFLSSKFCRARFVYRLFCVSDHIQSIDIEWPHKLPICENDRDETHRSIFCMSEKKNRKEKKKCNAKTEANGKFGFHIK